MGQGAGGNGDGMGERVGTIGPAVPEVETTYQSLKRLHAMLLDKIGRVEKALELIENTEGAQELLDASYEAFRQ